MFKRNKILGAGGALLLLALLTFVGWGAWRYATYPAVPDASAGSIDDAIAFMGTDDFNRLFERHRLAYMSAVVDRMGRESSFADLMRMMLRRDANRQQIAQNVRAVKGYDQIGAKMFALFLEKYHQLPPAQRSGALIAIAVAQQAQIATSPDEFKLPTPDEFRRDMSRFMSRQPPRVQAMMGQFLLDLKRQRDAMGLKDPF